MMDRQRFFLVILIACISVCFGLPSPAFADGFRNPFHDASAIAQGNAFAAQADNASAVFYNPAGMAQLPGLQTAGGIQFVSINTTFAGSAGASVSNSSPTIGLPPPGQLFLTANLKDLGVSALGNLSVGLGVLNLYGFAAKFPGDSPFATSLTFAQFPLISIKPTVAYKVTESLSVLRPTISLDTQLGHTAPE